MGRTKWANWKPFQPCKEGPASADMTKCHGIHHGRSSCAYIDCDACCVVDSNPVAVRACIWGKVEAGASL